MRSTPAGESAFLLAFETGDEFVATLKTFAAAYALPAAHFQGIGAFERATLAYWNWDAKRYEDIPVGEQVEVMTVSGNITRIADGFKVHAHTVLGRRDASTLGGHLKSGIVRPTLELVVTVIPQPIVRERDATSGLDLIRT